MPVSKTGKKYYTKAQYEKALTYSAKEYAMARGYDLVSDGGGYYHLREHDSMIFAPDGKWYWNSRHVMGGAIQFMMHYEGRSLVDSVLLLVGEVSNEEVTEEPTRPQKKAPKEQKNPPEYEPKEFVLPKRADNARQLFGYLCGVRGLKHDTVAILLKEGLIYEGILPFEGKEFHNLVLVYQDPKGNAVGAFVHGMRPKDHFRRAVAGSKKLYGWCWEGSRIASNVYVFEAAIDAASHFDMTNGMDVHRLSLEGLNPEPLWNFLARKTTIKNVALCLDADAPGVNAAKKIREELVKKGYHVNVMKPPAGKDWNEALVLEQQKQK